MWRGSLRYLAAMTALIFAILLLRDGFSDLGILELFAIALTGFAVALLALAATLLWFCWCIPRSVRRHFRQMKLEGETFEISFDENDIAIRDATNTTELTLSNLVKWTQSDRLILLYRTDEQAHYVPKSQLDPATLDALRAALQSASVRMI